MEENKPTSISGRYIGNKRRKELERYNNSNIGNWQSLKVYLYLIISHSRVVDCCAAQPPERGIVEGCVLSAFVSAYEKIDLDFRAGLPHDDSRF